MGEMYIQEAHMEYKRRILKLLDEIGDDEIVFLRQIYTIIKKHIEKRGKPARLSFSNISIDQYDRQEQREQ